MNCKWRNRHLVRLQRVPNSLDGSLGYCCRRHIRAITRRRERNLLDVYARLVELADHNEVHNTCAILDISQSLGRDGFRVDGTAPTVATNSNFFSYALGRTLLPAELFSLMGFDVGALNLQGFTHAELVGFIGNAMHVVVIAAATLAHCLTTLRQ